MNSEERKEQELADQTVDWLESKARDSVDGDAAMARELGQRLRELPDREATDIDQDLRTQLLEELEDGGKVVLSDAVTGSQSKRSFKRSRIWSIAASLLFIGLLAGMLLPATQQVREAARRGPASMDSDWSKNVDSAAPSRDGRGLAAVPRVSVPQQGQNESLPSAWFRYGDESTTTGRSSEKVLDDLLVRQGSASRAGEGGKLRGHVLLSDGDLASLPQVSELSTLPVNTGDRDNLQGRIVLAYTDGTPVGRELESDRFVHLFREVPGNAERAYLAKQKKLKELLGKKSELEHSEGTDHRVMLVEIGQKIEKAKAEMATNYSDRDRVSHSLRRGEDATKEMLETLLSEKKIFMPDDLATADSAREQIQLHLQDLGIVKIELVERYGPGHPRVKSVDRLVSQLEESLKRTVDGELVEVEKETATRKTLKSHLATLKVRILKNQALIRDGMREYAIHNAEVMKIVENDRRISDAREDLEYIQDLMKTEMLQRQGEQYAPIVENSFIAAIGGEAISTFAIDVDTASYANMRRFINNGLLPPPNAVRLEELINYFDYDYDQPKGDDPFSMNLELASCPWNDSRQLLRVGLQGKDVHVAERPATNVVFLIDVSGSMQDQNKLPLLKRGFQMLVDQLGEDDRVSIVTYAGNAGIVLNPTSGDQKDVIKGAIEKLTPGGSTHGSAGIELAYQLAQQNFIAKGSNKVILATDGDLNVGVTGDDQLVDLIKGKAAEGVFLTVLGFGTGNLKDGKLEKLADNGNGVYSYIDSLREAHKVLVNQLTGALLTIAKDVKIQIEFNPAEVKSYRLLGYENRALKTEDFANDRKDAGEIGAGHSVTALYEIVPAKSDQAKRSSVPVGMKYQSTDPTNSAELSAKPVDQKANLSKAAKSGELATVAVRYKRPDAQKSQRLDFTVANEEKSFSAASDDFRFACSVAGFGMLLRGSEFSGDASLAAIETMAANAVGDDASGYRTEFIDLIRKAASFSNRR